MAASKLSIYNQALGHLGERTLASLSENREPRRVLDDYYNGVISHCLEQGNWKFAHVSKRLNASNSVEPDFGFTEAFAKPEDFVRLSRISESADLELPLLSYREENGFWYADTTPIYVEFVSDSASLGGFDLSRWTQSFEDYVIARLARQAVTRICGFKPVNPEQASKLDQFERLEAVALQRAAEHNALGNAPDADVVRYCLERANWKFALRAREIFSTGTPDFNFQYKIAKPTDWVRTVILSASETFHPPLDRFTEEGGFWHTDCDPTYVRYISNSVTHGMDRTKWPQVFKDYVETRAGLLLHARSPAARLEAIDKLGRIEKKALGAARDFNMLATAPERPVTGSWVASRGGYGKGSRWDRQSP